jgi:hypothetical protein
MKTIKVYSHRDSCIRVIETNDANYARDCFDGTDREWKEIAEESAIGDLDSPMGTFYIVSSGLSGLYMADNVSVYGNRATALSAAKEEYERWQEEDSKEES